MHTQTLLLALAGAAAADMAGHVAVRRQLEARQTDDGGLSACAEAIATVVAQMPTPPAAITDFFATATETDPCSFTVPASLSAAYSSYGKALSSWSSAHASEFSSALAECPDFASFTDSIDAPAPTCGGSSGGSGGSGGSGSSGNSGSGDAGATTGSDAGSGASPSRTGSSSGAGSTSGSSSSGSGSGSGSSGSSGNNNNNNGGAAGKNAASRETGFAGAAIALAGFLGVVALL